MKKYIVVIIALLVHVSAFSQKQVRDEAVRSQERRQTFIKWGDWHPKARKPWWSPVNLNPDHEMVYGWTAPVYGGSKSRAKNYQRRDVRPLKPTGTQNLRSASLAQQSSVLDDALKEYNSLRDEFQKEYINQSGLTSLAEPAWIIYFSKAFKGLTDFNLANEIIKIRDVEVLKLLYEGGFMTNHTDEIKNLQDRLKNAQSQMMPKGQRLLFYHAVLKDYRKEMKLWNDHIRTMSLLMKNKRNLKHYEPNYIPNPNMGGWENRDEQIAAEVIARASVQ